MKEGRPKTWDKTKRFYEISHPNGKKEIWKDITARECLTRYESMDPYGNGLKLREIVGKELKLQKIMDGKKN
ncbi:hypothetical protein OAQ56_05650 [Alphaproteobacteria bacterium]|nr:hypothetical protein [Alphaproteobacteria bacterium]MDC1087124.1 hypothetical protein [Alphaproteobacteria bacterium]